MKAKANNKNPGTAELVRAILELGKRGWAATLQRIWAK